MALFNTAAAEDASRAGSILSSSFAGRPSVTASGRQQIGNYQLPSAARFQATLDLAALADGIAAQLKLQVITGIDAWNAARLVLPKHLLATLGRLIEVQLDRPTKDAMRKMREAQLRLNEWELEKARGPVMPIGPLFTLGITFDFYASLVKQYGSQPAREALGQRGMVLVGLRKQTSTLSNRGRGLYDDYIVVLNGVGRLGVASVFRACTEPTAQYSQRAAPTLAGVSDARYAAVAFNKKKLIEGRDVNNDGIKDLGRLVAGTYQYFEKQSGHLGDRAFVVATTQVAERDTDGDGRFTQADPDRIDHEGAQKTMYIHRGGSEDSSGGNTWSAGCQTIPTPAYPAFLATVGRPLSFFYVLINSASL